MGSPTSFFGYSDYRDNTITSQLQNNLVAYYDWCFLNIGAYHNVRVSDSGVYSRLTPVVDARKNPYQVWESVRGNWVWESGVNFGNPTRISGVRINDVFYSSPGSGNYAHTINYPNGYITFASGLPSTSKVEVGYAFKHIKFMEAEHPVFQRALFEAYGLTSPAVGPSGARPLPENRVNYPLVGVRVIERDNLEGMQLGGGQILYQDFSVDVIAQTEDERNKIIDIIRFQNDHPIWLFDVNRVADSNRFPLTLDGQIASGALTYPQMVSPSGSGGGFRWKFARFINLYTQPAARINPGLFHRNLRGTLEIEFPDI